MYETNNKQREDAFDKQLMGNWPVGYLYFSVSVTVVDNQVQKATILVSQREQNLGRLQNTDGDERDEDRARKNYSTPYIFRLLDSTLSSE